MVDLLELEEGGWRGHHCRLILPAGSDGRHHCRPVD